MDEVLEKCLKAAKDIYPGVEFVDADDYGDYYLFGYYDNGSIKGYPAINKKTFKKQENWQSVNIVLDEYHGTIKL